LKSGEVLHRGKEEKSILRTIRRREANWIVHILRRNCHIKHVIEGKIEARGRGGRRCKLLLEDLKEMIGFWKLE
jgi:hypothetical protein